MFRKMKNQTSQHEENDMHYKASSGFGDFKGPAVFQPCEGTLKASEPLKDRSRACNTSPGLLYANTRMKASRAQPQRDALNPQIPNAEPCPKPKPWTQNLSPQNPKTPKAQTLNRTPCSLSRSHPGWRDDGVLPCPPISCKPEKKVSTKGCSLSPKHRAS